MTLLEITSKGKRILEDTEKEKDRWLEQILEGFNRNERLRLLALVKRLIKNNVQFAAGDSLLRKQHSNPCRDWEQR